LGCRIKERIEHWEEIGKDEDTHDLVPAFWYEENDLVNMRSKFLRELLATVASPENKTSTPVAASREH
jgi:hypothetical protein